MKSSLLAAVISRIAARVVERANDAAPFAAGRFAVATTGMAGESKR